MIIKRLRIRTIAALGAAMAVSLGAQGQGVPPTSDTTPEGKHHEQTRSTRGTASTTTKASQSDQSFLKEALEGNRQEVLMAQLGMNKAQNEQLKQFSRQLKEDHAAANQQLMTIAQKLGVDTTAETSSKYTREMEKLNKLSAAEFDKEFAEAMLKDHQKDIEQYHKASKKVQDPELSQYIQTTLPKLHQHFHHAEQIATAVGVDADKIASYAKKLPPAVGGTSDESGTSSGKGTGQDASKHSDTLK